MTGRARDRGAGLVGTLAGFVVVLAFLFLAVQVSVDFYATSVVTAVAYDAARDVATATEPADPAVRAAAELRARDALGGAGDSARFDWAVDADVVRLRVRVANPRFVLPMLAVRLPFDAVDRTVVLRVERPR